MSTVFNTIINMSITGSVAIMVVILVRFVLQKIPKKYSYILWSVAGFRLCCPFSFESVVSLFNINPIQNYDDFVSDHGTMNYIDIPVYTQTPHTNIETISEAEAPATVVMQNHFTDFIPYIWLLGLIFLVAICIINFVKIRKQLLTATKRCGNIYQSESISSPFILGIIKPKIYIPYNIDEEYFDYVIAHERYHLKRGDNFIKLFAFILLCVHWFNPFCWLAFYLVNKDMEMSCDEWVLSHNAGIKKAYSNALLSFATEKNFLTPSPLCFVEGSAKSRIKNILKYKKPAILVSIVAIILCIAVTVVCITNPIHSAGQNEDISKELFSSSQTNDNAAFNFIYDYYWYNVIQDDDDTRVVCSKYNDDYTIDSTIYTIDKSGKWSTENEKCQFDFDENNTIIIYDSDNKYSRTWWHINTETESIEERDKNTANGKIIQTLIPMKENSISGAQKAIALYQKPYQYINAYVHATRSWSNGKITIDLGENEYPQLRWALEDGVSIKSADLVISIDGKEVFTEPMSIKDIRNENPNNHIWDYLAYTQKDKYIMDCQNKESICEVYAKCFDDKGAEYHVYFTPTKFNTENDAIAYTYILYNGYEFWY
ncbi:MAG: M56 family metallopeptidase [Eubacterium sp.]|nr:M56 family metallopeptidase [Eubacterium sp.]